MFAESNIKHHVVVVVVVVVVKPHKDGNISYKASSLVVPRMVATSDKNVKLAFLNDQTKQLKSMV